MKKLVGYNGDKEYRRKFLRAMTWHARQDAILQGTYGTMFGDDWKGCAVACGVRSIEKIAF